MGWVSGGADLEELRRRIMERLDVEDAVLCSSGSYALELVLCWCGVAAGDEVVIPSFLLQHHSFADSRPRRAAGARRRGQRSRSYDGDGHIRVIDDAAQALGRDPFLLGKARRRSSLLLSP